MSFLPAQVTHHLDPGALVPPIGAILVRLRLDRDAPFPNMTAPPRPVPRVAQRGRGHSHRFTRAMAVRGRC